MIQNDDDILLCFLVFMLLDLEKKLNFSLALFSIYIFMGLFLINRNQYFLTFFILLPERSFNNSNNNNNQSTAFPFLRSKFCWFRRVQRL